ncbi:MAG: transcription antitermination factor NusB [Phycisphaerales bacterium]
MSSTFATARGLVCEQLVEILPSFPDLPSSGPDLTRLAPRDAALARAIDGAVRRRWLSLEAVLRARVSRDLHTLEPGVRAALLAGAAQLLLLRRLPDHAVLHEAVEWTKRHVRVGAGNLVNAVLRAVIRMRDEASRGRLDAPATDTRRGESIDDEASARLGRNELPLDDGEVLRFREEIFPVDPASRLAAQTSHGPAMVHRWMATHGATRAAALCLHGVALPPTILRLMPGDSADAGEGDALLLPHERRGFAVLAGEPGSLAKCLARSPATWVQDPTSAAAVDACAALGPFDPGLIVDPCAGNGTKMRQLAHAFPRARLIASDPDSARLAMIRGAAAATASSGVAAASIEVVPAHELARRAAALGRDDLVLLDVPCSATGVLARRLEARYRLSPARLRRLVELQQRMIRDGAALLRPGGRILHSTCSVEPEENERSGRGSRRRWRSGGSAESILPAAALGDAPTSQGDGGRLGLFGPVA